MAAAVQDPKTDKQQCSHCHDAGHHAHHAAAPRRPLDPSQPVEWTCPMHPEIVRDAPGSCPICGMALEPRTVTRRGAENPELRDMTRRFWVAVAARPCRCSSSRWAEMLAGGWSQRLRRPARSPGSSSLLATPVVLWGGWPFFVRGWHSVVNRSLNMFTLIALGVGVAYVYSVVATLAPGLFPRIVPRHARRRRASTSRRRR